jgi:hypothetical protein
MGVLNSAPMDQSVSGPTLLGSVCDVATWCLCRRGGEWEREEERVGKREGKTRAVPVASVASYTGQSLGRNQVLTTNTSI